MMLIQLMPFANEALHSYLLRLAQGYGLQNSKQLLKAVSLKSRLSYDEQQLGRLGDEFKLSIDELAVMNPTPEAGPILNLKYQRSACSPICSCCVEAAPYVRASWDHELITACPLHGVLLMDTCPGCGDSITRERESITHCLCCNFSFAGADEKPAEDFDLALSALIAGAEHPARALLPKGLQSGSPPPDIAAFLAYLAIHIQPVGTLSVQVGKGARPKTIQESRVVLKRAWSVLTLWPTGLETFIDARIREGKGRSVHQRLGRWLAVFQKGFDRETYSFFVEAVERVLLEKFDGHLERYRRRNQSDLTKDKGWYSAAEVASLLNSTPSLVVAAVESGRLSGRIEPMGNSRFVSVHRDVIESIRKAREGHLTQTEARKRLGITKIMLQRLAEVGAVQELNKDDLPPLVSGSFRVIDVDGLARRLKDAAKSKAVPAEYSVGMQDISIKSSFLHADIISILQDITHGVLCAVEVVPDAVGLAALRFDIREMRNRLKKEKAEPLLRISDLVAFGGWKRDDIKQWIQGGFLRVQCEQHGQRMITRVPLSALIEFMTQYIVMSDVSAALKTTTNDLLRTLRPAKIQPAISTLTGQRPVRGLLVESLAMIRGAQLRKPTIRDLREQLEACA